MFTEEQKQKLIESKTEIIGIAAVNSCNYIGLEGHLVIRNKEDMQHFVRTTKGSVVIIGRKTFESCRRPMLGRSVCVLTRDPVKCYPDALVFNNAEQLVKHIVGFSHVYIAGGAEIYGVFEGVYSGFLLTTLDDATKGDIKLPFNLWRGVTDGEWKYEHSILISHGKINQLTKVKSND